MGFLPYIIFLFIFSCIFILASQYFSYKEEKRFIRERFAFVKRKKRQIQLKLTLFFKALAPINARIGSKALRENTRHRLLAAGSSLTVDEYFVLKELLLLFLPLIVGLVIGWDVLGRYPLLIVLLAGFGFMYPNFWVKSRAERRKKEVLRALPSVIDLLILAVDAGLDFMVAVRRVVERSRPSAIVDELSQMYREVQMGLVRRDSLKNMAKRIDIPEVHSFTRTLIQAERMGTPMGEALRALSDEIRTRRFQRGEQQALKAPIKMLFPLLVCILPVVLILVAGPVILQFLQAGTELFK